MVTRLRVAALADVHGNSWALEAVLADLAERRVDRVVNPGSVGLPAYCYDSPRSHAMEAGSPHARYAIVDLDDARCRVEQIAVPYDWETAARTAATNGRHDWATWLRTGRAG